MVCVWMAVPTLMSGGTRGRGRPAWGSAALQSQGYWGCVQGQGALLVI